MFVACGQRGKLGAKREVRLHGCMAGGKEENGLACVSSFWQSWLGVKKAHQDKDMWTRRASAAVCHSGPEVPFSFMQVPTEKKECPLPLPVSLPAARQASQSPDPSSPPLSCNQAFKTGIPSPVVSSFHRTPAPTKMAKPGTLLAPLQSPALTSP